ncbi:preprotein translocase subunit SecA [Pseudactinotalea sp. HY158]|uniref:preprotein translocase subunit SecA n=1 Tax=Pseudactinotalea sp. HY158 TaxID=2654547 RepID=UPI00129D220E|nr:preprotein translocase subunit SecA [Pseudactinotalea sp. HY158]
MGEGKTLKRLQGLVNHVNTLEEDMQALSDAELREETDRFRERLADGSASLDSLLPEAFAAVREAAVRTIGQRPYDVQVLGGAALHMGAIAEMKTGEGKTLVATMPAYLNALGGKGVHIITVNDYLVTYQAELMGRVHRFLGLSVGTILSGQQPAVRREQYAADITYGTNNEYGFDYLRDNMALSLADTVQRGHNMAIVDEVDSILIDEARTPLIISGPASGDVNKWYGEFARVARRLTRDADYEVDETKRNVGVLEPGIEKVEDYLGIDNLYESLNTPLVGFLNNAIKAKELFFRDKDYVVMKGEVLIVDQHTGRILPGRRYNEGMHQAIEAKEGVAIKAENQTFATITLQNYFRLYSKLAGMTGTAKTEAAEFNSTYEVEVVPVPTNKPVVRSDQADLVYRSESAKFNAVVEDIVARHAKGQPVLVGTTSVEKSELLSGLLKKQGVPHEVLNAKQHAREASIVAMAGRKGAVTVATNMAGRGTDIMLGGNAEHLAIAELTDRGLSPVETPEEYEAAWDEALADAKASVVAEHDEVAELGGLYVVGTERHESRRIDNQLQGRSGRQGDPGESRFYLSLEDELMRLFATGFAERFIGAAYPDDLPLESKLVTRTIEGSQRKIEGRNVEIRKNVLKYDDVLTEQRKWVYHERRDILEGMDVEPLVKQWIDQVIAGVVGSATAGSSPEEWDLGQLWTDIRQIFPVSITADEVVEDAGAAIRVTSEQLTTELTADAHVAYEAREAELGGDIMRQLERRVVLSVLDRKWREHLYEMDYLKEGIGLRAMAQRDPLVEYRDEGHMLFQAMAEAIKEESVGFLFNLEVRKPQEQAAPAEGEPAAGEPAAAVTGGAAAAQTEGSAGAEDPSTAGRTKDRAAQKNSGRRAGAKTAPVRDALGLEVEDAPAKLNYSAPSLDGPAAAAEPSEKAGVGAGAPAQAGSGNREERRRAAKAAKKQR